MQSATNTDTLQAEPETLLEAIRYYSDLDIATQGLCCSSVAGWSGLSLVRFQRKLLRSKSPDLEMQALAEAILAQSRYRLRRFSNRLRQVADSHVDDRQ
jgi:hypothetical protein